MSCCQKSGQAPQQTQGCGGGSSKIGEGDEEVWGAVKKYYGQELKGKDDTLCQMGEDCKRIVGVPQHVRTALEEVHEEVTNKYYGCGLVIPEAVEGCTVLDLGSGTGRDCFAVSKLVGSSGRVVGVDMTEEQLAVARKYIDYHTEKFGYSKPNVEYVLGQIEKLSEAGLKENTFDLIISNCVINLCPDKRAALKEAYGVLKEGGELYFSDVYTDTNLSPAIRQHRLLWGECVAGALHWKELYELAEQLGFSRPRLISVTKVDVARFSDILGEAKFVSAAYRLFKLPKAAPAPSVATYNGGIQGYPDQFKLDHATIFKKNEGLAVDGEVAAILSSSRFRKYFSFDTSGTVTPVTTDPVVDPFQKVEGKAKCC